MLGQIRSYSYDARLRMVWKIYALYRLEDRLVLIPLKTRSSPFHSSGV